VKYERVRVIRITAIELIVSALSAVKARSPTTQLVRGSAKLSAAKAEPRKPARVIAIWIAERNAVGSSESFKSFLAFLSPSSAARRRRLVLSHTSAISADAKNALTAMSAN
jgi:hypothetical protein